MKPSKEKSLEFANKLIKQGYLPSQVTNWAGVSYLELIKKGLVWKHPAHGYRNAKATPIRGTNVGKRLKKTHRKEHFKALRNNRKERWNLIMEKANA